VITGILIYSVNQPSVMYSLFVIIAFHLFQQVKRSALILAAYANITRILAQRDSMIAVQRDTVLCEPTNLAATDKQYIININVGPSWNSIIRFGVIELLRKNAWCFCMRYNNCNDF
jgi:hypothetical protein